MKWEKKILKSSLQKMLKKNRNEMINEKSEIFTAENDPEKHDRNCKRKNEIFTANGKSSRKTGME